ncbi:MAG: sigma-70 family RNA polymerase sigma factor [Clostridiales bacterium]|nr:sigma-70 family RNA polymerase sigma factor [Clostridiales bacterium]
MSNEEIVMQIQQGIDVTLNQERLWKQNQKFVRLMVKRTFGFPDDDQEDYMQEGAIGLLKAAALYRPEEGAKFITFAAYHIRAAILRYSENCCHSVRTPAYLKERIRKYEKLREQYIKAGKEEPTEQEYMDELHISRKSLLHLEKTIRNMKTVSLSISEYGEDSGVTLSDMIQSDTDIEDLITHSVYLRELKEALDSALSILDNETAAMIRCSYYQGNSWRQTAQIFGCTVQNVSRRIYAGFWKILHSGHREDLESFMWEGYCYNEFAYSGYENPEDEENEFLI